MRGDPILPSPAFLRDFPEKSGPSPQRKVLAPPGTKLHVSTRSSLLAKMHRSPSPRQKLFKEVGLEDTGPDSLTLMLNAHMQKELRQERQHVGGQPKLHPHKENKGMRGHCHTLAQPSEIPYSARNIQCWTEFLWKGS